MSRTIGGQFIIQNKIGAGSFGTIYEGEKISDHSKVAIKLEPLRAPIPQLNYEYKLYTLFSGSISVPKVHLFTRFENDNALVMDLLGNSLEELFVLCGQQLSVKTVLMLADQMISAVQYIHEKSFIHNDIKPDNFVMGLGKNRNQLFIIDFGLSKKYRDATTHIHCQYEDGKSLTGTPRYASINALKGIRQTRRDDMESLGFVWIYLMRGYLPWMGINARNTEQKYAMICEAKEGCSPEDLCAGFPREFAEYFRSVRALKYDERPNYALYRQKFREAFLRLGYKLDYRYDWIDSRGHMIRQREPTNIPVFKKTVKKEVRQKTPTMAQSRMDLFKRIQEEQMKNPEPVSEYSDAEPKTSDAPTLMMGSDSESPATCEAVAFNAPAPSIQTIESESSESAPDDVQVISFKPSKSAGPWRRKEHPPAKPPFNLPVESPNMPRWMIPRASYH